ncbi:PREDICTED: protein CURVATURE THYLAKOID 1D, chloroplastic-like isoform X1 [Nelumbo nucifera]|uniref:Protein CURVATURE THYLAKOID 1D, chloroplastic-like isoform X1 n=1 Tax=Nelumbo nucifera TaxID=4432 RepID=A0A1U8BA26_NELNU|nr:PREDICTED: protein CURVATURE THYLAKOID 1D, chloroplastic-like isoform X1 [Nelumbo nucifera]
MELRLLRSTKIHQWLALKRLIDVSMGVLTPLSEQLTKPLPNAMVLINLKELSSGTYKLLLEGTRLAISVCGDEPYEELDIFRNMLGLHYFATPFLRATTSEETSTSVNEQLKEASDGVTIVEETPIILKNEQNALYEAPMDEPLQSFVHMLDLEDAYPILLYGGGALVAVWLASVLVGAFDSIPLFSKVMEVVGIAYTIWFTTRYLIFKKNRNELSEKIEELKEQVLGSTDD